MRGEEHVGVHELGVEPAGLVVVVVHDRNHAPPSPQLVLELPDDTVQPQEASIRVPLVYH